MAASIDFDDRHGAPSASATGRFATVAERPIAAEAHVADSGRLIAQSTRAAAYRRTKNLRAVQLLLGHSKLESTGRYLGIAVDDALEIAEQTEVWI